MFSSFKYTAAHERQEESEECGAGSAGARRPLERGTKKGQEMRLPGSQRTSKTRPRWSWDGFRRHARRPRLSRATVPAPSPVRATATRVTSRPVPARLSQGPAALRKPKGSRPPVGDPGLPLLRGPRWFPRPREPVSQHPLRPGFGSGFGSSRWRRVPTPSPGTERQRSHKMSLVTARDGDL